MWCHYYLEDTEEQLFCDIFSPQKLVSLHFLHSYLNFKQQEQPVNSILAAKHRAFHILKITQVTSLFVVKDAHTFSFLPFIKHIHQTTTISIRTKHSSNHLSILYFSQIICTLKIQDIWPISQSLIWSKSVTVLLYHSCFLWKVFCIYSIAANSTEAKITKQLRITLIKALLFGM